MNINYLLVVGAFVSSVAIAEEVEVVSPITETGIVKVEWLEPDNYNDIKASNELQSRFENRFFETMTKNINKQAEKTLKPNQKLEMQVSNVDLAGDMRPTFGATTGDLRVVKELYPPKMTFTYQILEDNKVIISGDEKLTDMSFLSRISRINERPFSAETTMLNDWLKRTVAPQLEAPKAL
ncbi:DUF3016 domain-containing protein [Shewanella glacialimarina]|jgi:hypothetical protein|uniref:DUF3016 domain-containing protein n=1 Tax=Shewanella glacialimarina TaxID=2590884 RepID=UPI001CF8F59D|nr:DUF3016 domain-containing protein [Shewanella glacialimarina]UCX03486.1 DUF3016 domain-containing protein [Shewanella glacialimarina]